MTIAKWGLLLDLVGVLLVGLEAFVRTRGIGSESIVVGHGANEFLMGFLAKVGYLLLFAGFGLQFLAAP